MKRRHFLHCLSVMGAGATLPAFGHPLPDIATAMSDADIEWPCFEIPQPTEDAHPRIVVVAAGGAAGAILAAQGDLPGKPRTLAINTDASGLQHAGAERSILLGSPSERKAHSLQQARRLAQGMKNEIADALADCHLAIVIAGMGGAAGSGIAPVVAEVLHEQRIPVVGIPILPFAFEGERRRQIALAGQQAFERWTTSRLTIPNDTFFRLADGNARLSAVTGQAANIFGQFYRLLHNAISVPGWVSVDYEDVCYLLAQGKRGGFGCGSSAISVLAAAQEAVAQPLLGEEQLCRARGLYVAIEGKPSSLRMSDVREVMKFVRVRAEAETILFSAAPHQALAANYSVSIFSVGA